MRNIFLPLHPPCSPNTIHKVGPTLGMQSLYKQQSLKNMTIMLDFGESRNKNKRASIDKIIQELENELIKITKPQSRISLNCLSLSVANLNSHIRATGLSAYTQWIGRNQYSKCQLRFSDQSLIEQHFYRGMQTTANLYPAPSQQTSRLAQLYISSMRNLHHSLIW